ncbi:BREX system Lon protease-like protein BrxL [Infirmifilum lucidum]|uniref:BREX system Lon protease-like protein BrxL n=1 Tax=Infirmifilum lucidum TaxID=2776706 RepID=A0A7L9FG50_9CREN|nr:BREX system Lon protease-like protein BrxL [Infirmifilum lucidum]QOJ78729.1 BREX system Lon protease-like protein BrxL [Infirmifilum lucidum]
MSALDAKIKRVFGEYAVDKRVARSGSIPRIPTFIKEYLITRYCQEGDSRCLEDIAQKVSELYPDPRSRERFLGRLKEEGRLKLLDEFRVVVNLKKNAFFLQIPSLNITDALVRDDIVRGNERLYSGLWGVGVLVYEPPLQSRLRDVTPVVMDDFEPFQAYDIDFELFSDARGEFTLEEWLSMLVRSMGLNPEAYTLRQRALLVARLIPMAESNVNLLELGPRATGKTYTYRELTYYSRIHSGGTVSPARLFYDIKSKIPGDLVVNDVVVFDEINRIKFASGDEVVAKLKDYMVDGYFERGGYHPKRPATCSLVFIGNIDIGEAYRPLAVASYLPAFMHDTAFLDRIHGFLHGWELPKIMKSDEHLAQGYGIAADYLAEVLHEYRNVSLEQEVDEVFELEGRLTIRDEKAIKKLLSGALKLLFPNREYDKSELESIATALVDLRNNVSQLLTAMSPREFPEKKIKVRVRG